MRRIMGVFILAVALLLLAPPPLMAQETASLEFPNDKDGSTNNVAAGVSGDMKVRATVADAFLPNIVTGPIFLDGPMTGREVATSAYNALCTAAENAGYTCDGGSGSKDGELCGPEQPDNPSCCDSKGLTAPTPDPNDDPDLVIDLPSQVICQQTSSPSGPLKGLKFIWGFKEDSGDYGVDVEPFPMPTDHDGTKLKAVNAMTKAGNTVVEDILPRFCLRVDRDGAAPDGDITLSVTHLLAGLPLTLSFTVDSTGLGDAALHQAIAGGLEALPLDLGILVLSSPGDMCEFDATFNGPLISISNIVGQNVTAIGVSGLQGQDIIVEQSRTTSKIEPIAPLF